MATTKTKFITASILATGFATAFVAQYRVANGLRQDLAAQTTRVREANPANHPTNDNSVLEEEVKRLREEHAELLRLRGEVAFLRKKEADRSPQIAQSPASSPVATPIESNAGGEQFIASDQWANVGADTPSRAFQSFLAALKTGDPQRFNSLVHWEVKWKDKPTDEDVKLVQKSMRDYLEMLQKAPQKIAAFNLAPVQETDSDRTRVFFQTLTPSGERVSSSFEMLRSEGQWKPILSMRWLDPKNAETFSTSPVFGPQIDLERPNPIRQNP